MQNPLPNPASNLQAIETKVRRLTRNMSESQLSTAEIDNYINTFILYDFPEHIRTFNFRTTFNFWANPYQDVYPTDTASFGDPVANPTIENNPLYNFQNTYLTVHPPVYIAGYQSFYTQSREQFYGVYPLTNSIASIGPSGDGATLSFTGVVNSQQSIVPGNLVQTVTLLQNNVLFSSVDTTGAGLALVDVPVLDAATGNPSINGNLYVPSFQPFAPPTVITPNNTINYVTGKFTITFPFAPGVGVPINSQTVPQIVSLPQALCYYNNKFILRPVPDQPYQINFEAYIRPTALLNENAIPDLEEYWQYIAYGAAKKIFEDRMDLDSVALIMPEFKKQEALMLRRTIVQYTNERTATIYTEQTSFGTGFGAWGGAGGGPF